MTSIVVALAVAAVTITMNAIVNTKIRFASDEATALRALRSLGRKVIDAGLVVILLFSLYNQVSSPEPVTRPAVLGIGLNLVVLLYILVQYHLFRMLDVMRRTTELQGELTRVVRKGLKT